MSLEIIKIQLKDLQDFLISETYRQLTVTPVTGLRVSSYINNPKSLPGDHVLYLGFIKNKLVAFRTLFADNIGLENEKVRFAWCSGNWVDPKFRRQGFSEQLLKEALTDWDGKLMFTNYAPESEKLYLKTGSFHPVHQFKGFRGYLFPKTRKLIKAARKNGLTKALFSAADQLISVFSTSRLWFFSSTQNPDIRFETCQFPDEECLKISSNYSSKYLFGRGEKELNWIFKYPWISGTENSESKKYPFSSLSDSFSYYTIKVFVKNKFVGFFVFSVREGHLKTLHFCLPDEFGKDIAGYLKQFCKKQKIELITVYNYRVAQQLFNQKFPFLHTKKYGQKIYSSFEIKDNHGNLFQDGDGDVIFT